ncbi:MAG: hypothetical protein Q8P04_01990, partial [bacterium]|nr:hypothetical protein [bacterium]
IFFGVLALLLFLSLFTLQVILLANADHYLRTAVVLNGLGWASFFYQAVSLYYFVAFGFLILFLFLAGRRGKNELGDSLKIKISRIVRSVIGLSLTAIVIFVFVSMVLAGKFTLTEEGVKQLADVLVAPVARHYVKDFSSDMETGVFFARLAERNLAANSALKGLPSPLKSQVVNQSVTELKKNIEGYLGAEIDLHRSVSGNLYEALQFKINTLTLEAKIYWILIVLGLIFLSIKSIESLIALPLTLFVFILYQAVLISNFASVDLRDRSQEVVLLDK